jgi:ribosomal protein S18 acetylase RimI-like enzyme
VLQIGPVDHRDVAVSRRIHAVLQLAYAQEAALLRVKHFAPLERTVEDVRCADEHYLAALHDGELVGALSVGRDDEPDRICITALVVHPSFQRRGIARALLRDALRRGQGKVVTVSTGAANAPALALYRSLGFVDYRHGVVGPEDIRIIKLRTAALPMPTIRRAGTTEAEAILAIQKRAFAQEARLSQDMTIPPLTETLDAVLAHIEGQTVLVACDAAQIIGSVRGIVAGTVCTIRALSLEPACRGRGVGAALLQSLESAHPDVTRFELLTNALMQGNVRFYQRHGYTVDGLKPHSTTITLVAMSKATGR